MDITFFDDIQARRPRPVRLTWETFANLVARPPAAHDKKGLRWIKLAMYGDKRSPKGCARFDNNVVALTGIELDYDSPVTDFRVACERLARAGVRSALHSTPSYWRDGSFRVLVPFNSPLYTDLKAQREDKINRIARIVGEAPARESYVLSQAYYFGRIETQNYLYGIVSSDGSFVTGAVYHDWPNYYRGVPAQYLGGTPYF